MAVKARNIIFPLNRARVGENLADVIVGMKKIMNDAWREVLLFFMMD